MILSEMADFDYRLMEDVLCVEAFGEDYGALSEYRSDNLMYNEDEDSNEEGNWRNDYPDEDYHYRSVCALAGRDNAK